LAQGRNALAGCPVPRRSPVPGTGDLLTMAEKKAEKKDGKTPAPDRALHDEAMQHFEVTISGFQREVQDVNKMISEKSTGKEEFLLKKEEMKAKLDEYQAIIDKHDSEKKDLFESLDAEKKKGREMRGELNEMKKKLPFDSVEDIDKKIKEIENKMMTETMSLKQEKAHIVEIAQLKQQKPRLAQYARMEEASKGPSGETGTGQQTRLSELKKLIEEARAAKRAQMEQYKKLIEQRRKVMADMPSLFEKRDQLNKQIAKQVQARATVREEFQRKQQAHQAYLSEKRQVMAEKSRAERLQRQADWEKRQAERQNEKEDEMPNLAETVLLEQTLAYCTSMVSAKKEEVVELKEVQHNNPEGSMVLCRKADRETDEIDRFNQIKSGKNKKDKNKENKKTKTSNIKHDVETIQIFSNLKLSPPATTAEIPELVEKLNAKLVELRVGQKTWEAKREERRVAAAKQLAEADAKAAALRKEAEEITAKNKERLTQIEAEAVVA